MKSTVPGGLVCSHCAAIVLPAVIRSLGLPAVVTDVVAAAALVAMAAVVVEAAVVSVAAVVPAAADAAAAHAATAVTVVAAVLGGLGGQSWRGLRTGAASSTRSPATVWT